MKFQQSLHMVGSVTLALGLSAALCGAAASTITHKVVSEFLQSGNPGTTLSNGYNTMETATVQCSKSTCTIGMTVMSTVSEATCTSEWAIVGLVDGNSVDGGPDQDGLPHAGNTQTRNWQGIYQVGYGKHTVAFQIYVPCPVTANQWSVNYMVTTP